MSIYTLSELNISFWWFLWWQHFFKDRYVTNGATNVSASPSVGRIWRHQLIKKCVGTEKKKITCGSQNQRWRACLDTSVFTFVTLPSEESVTNTVWRPGGLGEGPGSSFRQEKIQFGKLNYSRWSHRPSWPRGRGECKCNPPDTASDSAHTTHV